MSSSTPHPSVSHPHHHFTTVSVRVPSSSSSGCLSDIHILKTSSISFIDQQLKSSRFIILNFVAKKGPLFFASMFADIERQQHQEHFWLCNQIILQQGWFDGQRRSCRQNLQHPMLLCSCNVPGQHYVWDLLVSKTHQSTEHCSVSNTGDVHEQHFVCISFNFLLCRISSSTAFRKTLS